MKAEIGSEFWEVPLCKSSSGCSFPKEASFFLSGRYALDFIIRDIQAYQKFNSVQLPSYCCETMIAPFLAHNIEVSFYPVYLDATGHLVQEFPKKNLYDAILVMDYFGYVDRQNIPLYGGIVIQDITHSAFSGIQSRANYVFGSLRKWAGFYTGGVAWKNSGSFCISMPSTTNEEYVQLRKQAMIEKEKFIDGKTNEKTHLSLFEKAESNLCSLDGYASTEVDLKRVNELDVEFLCKKRRENAQVLLQSLSELAFFPNLEKKDCPLFVPIGVPDGKRDALKRYLILQQIYCPVHWPVSPLHELTAQTQFIYDSELSIICDQRYDIEDMKRISNEITTFFKQEI